MMNTSQSPQYSQEYEIFATCPEELKSVVAQEMADLGFYDIRQGYRAVFGFTNELGYYKAHLDIPTASHIYRVLRRGKAHTPEMLFTHARRVPWTKVMGEGRRYRIDAVAGDRGDGAMPSDFIGKKIRQAIEDVFTFEGQKKPVVDLKEPDVVVCAMVREGRVTLSLQTSGKSLHKRGYRLDGHPAPIKETLARGILKLIGYDGTKPLLDPMAGSGTFVIEAAFIALDKSPLIHRKKDEFAFEALPDFNRSLWRDIQDERRIQMDLELKAPIFARDISPDYLNMIQKNALRARVEKYLDVEQGSFFDLNAPAPEGILVANLPYGSRLDEKNMDWMDFYKRIGDKLKQDYTGWDAWLLVNEDTPWKHIGLKPSKKIPLYNGDIKTRLVGFNLYQGRKTR